MLSLARVCGARRDSSARQRPTVLVSIRGNNVRARGGAGNVLIRIGFGESTDSAVFIAVSGCAWCQCRLWLVWIRP
jgi:hypothetical protein